MITLADLPTLPPRAATSHKGDFGRALLIGGSLGMSGAISLAGMACLRSGTGLVTLAVPAECLNAVAACEPSYMTTPLLSDDAGRLRLGAWQQIAERLNPVDVVACGPGLSRSRSLSLLVQRICRDVRQPVVFDADALNALAESPSALSASAGPRVLTPHPGEFRRLAGAVDDSREVASRLAAAWQAVIVLKGHRTFVTDGDRHFENTTGNPGMATGGSGDVLTGVITALIAQKLPPFEAACLAVHLHGLAGDLAAEAHGQTSLIARDLVEQLPAAFRA